MNVKFGRLPLAFEPNEGQVDPQVRFLCRGRGYSLFVTPATHRTKARSCGKVPVLSKDAPLELESVIF